MAAKILLVDDEAGIIASLSDILTDEGYEVFEANDGHLALEQIKVISPDLVFLDIWLPGKDGLEILKTIKSDYPKLPVIMISGHATISTAVKATQIGAADFIEKPLDLNTVLETVKTAISLSSENTAGPSIKTTDSSSACRIKSIEYLNDLPDTPRVKQKTLASSSILYGLGVHSGQKSGLIVEPLPENSGIHFAGVASESAVPALVEFVSTTGYATTIKNPHAEVSTVEHLLSAFHAYGITNALIKCNKEVPVMDGSALDFCQLIEEIGVKEQDAEIPLITVNEKIEVGEGEERISIEPADSFIIDYTLSYPAPIGEQHFVFELNNPSSFKEEIAPCRTFGFVKDIDYLQKQGLAQGGRFNNFVLIGDSGIINSELRFPDEAVRHKILDIIGDLYLIGQPIRAKITAKMTGHSDNIDLLKALKAKLVQ